MKSSLKKNSKKSKEYNAWKMLWFTFLWLVMILVIIYLILAIYLTWQYFTAKRKLEMYSIMNLKVMSDDLNAQYDFGKDNLAMKHTNSKLARDLTDGLLRFYDNNLQTVNTVVSQIVRQPVNMSTELGSYDLTAFKSHAQDFVVNVSKYVKPNVLNETNYFVRFFSMVMNVLPLESTDTIVREIQDFLQEILKIK